MLLDEFEKLLECRVLKDEEIVSSCESLTFNSYLVDVADPEGHHVTVPGFRREIRRCRSVDLVSRLGRSSDVPLLILVTANLHLLSSQTDQIPIAVLEDYLSSDFRKSELQKYEAPDNGKDTVTLGAAEWQVMYTSQMTQKAKKYHDGYMKLENRGSLGRFRSSYMMQAGTFSVVGTSRKMKEYALENQ
ncbi:unnamed protein product [Linum trigynum]|uniref:5'-3' DNA helicase ZGRF1-like N-terminal domain-containing protein n=1 Tax=Linum trigynum TaxID=586398 RepID=A0AAV2DJI4_9ROSI